MKKTLSFVLAFCLLAALAVPLAVFTASADTDGDWIYSVSNGEATITVYNGSASSVTIPSTLGGYPVTAIYGGKTYFFGVFYSITSITIPDGVTSIGEGAFYGCTSLTSITLPSSVTSIGRLTFRGCTSLSSITIPDGVTSIGSAAFEACTSLTSITIPESVTSIGSSAFSGCTSLSSITIPESVTSIGSSAFSDCTSLSSITIPESVTSIGSSAFYGCTSLTSITIPDSVTSIGERAFRNCTSLTSITIPDSVKMIDNRAFQGCTGLTEVTILGSPVFRTDVFTDSQGFPLDLTLYGYRDSSVKIYALANALNFVPLDGDEPDFLWGDATGDGRIDLSDVTRLAKYVAGWDVTLGPEA